MRQRVLPLRDSCDATDAWSDRVYNDHRDRMSDQPGRLIRPCWEGTGQSDCLYTKPLSLDRTRNTRAAVIAVTLIKYMLQGGVIAFHNTRNTARRLSTTSPCFDHYNHLKICPQEVYDHKRGGLKCYITHLDIRQLISAIRTRSVTMTRSVGLLVHQTSRGSALIKAVGQRIASCILALTG